jgi:hypothetical protein
MTAMKLHNMKVYSIKNITINGYIFTLTKYEKNCKDKGCYNIYICPTWYGSCPGDMATPILINMKLINDISVENENTLVIRVPKETKVNGHWWQRKLTADMPEWLKKDITSEKILNGVSPEKSTIDGVYRENYGYIEKYKANIVIEYK